MSVCEPVVGLILFSRPKRFKNAGLKEVGKNPHKNATSTHTHTFRIKSTKRQIPSAEVNPSCYISNHSDTQFLFSGD